MAFSITKTINEIISYLQDVEFLKKELVVDTVYTLFTMGVFLFIVMLFIAETGLNIIKMLESTEDYYKGIVKIVTGSFPVKSFIVSLIWILVIGPLVGWHYYYLTNLIALYPRKPWRELLAPVFGSELIERIKGIVVWGAYNVGLGLMVIISMGLSVIVVGDLTGMLLALVWPLVLFPFWLYAPQFYFLHKVYNKSNRVAMLNSIKDVIENYPKLALLTLVVNGVLFIAGFIVGIVSTLLKGTGILALPSFLIDFLMGWYLAQIPRVAVVSVFKQLHWQASD